MSIRKILVSLVALGLIAGACSSDDDDGGDAAGGATTTAGASAPDDTGPDEGGGDDGTDADDGAPAGEAPDDVEQVFRSALPGNSFEGSPWTTTGHKLDATVLQPLAAIRWTGDGVEPLLAESWDTPDGGQTWTVNLRQGVTWHDGEPFDADDVVFSFNVYANPEVGSRYSIRLSDVVGYDEVVDGTADALAGVTKVDDLTVQIELKEALPIWWDFSQIFVVIFPEHILGEVAPAELRGHPYWTEDRVGTGPFVWSDYRPDQFVELVAYDDYFLGRPQLDRIVYQVFADTDAMLNAMANGEIDETPFEEGGIPIPELGRFEDLDFLTVKDQDAGLPTYFFLNLDEEPYSDINFRQALMHGIDRQLLIDTLWEGRARLANTLFPAEWAHPADLETYDYDPDRARELVEASVYDGRELPLRYFFTDPLTADLLVAIQSQLAEVGINVVPEQVDTAAWRASLTDGSWEMGYGSNGQGLDPSVGADPVTCGAVLALGYCNERIDELFTLGKTESARDDRAPFYQEISTILNEELPKTFLWYPPRPIAFNNRVAGLAEHWEEQPVLLFNLPVYQEIETWFIRSDS